MIRNRAEFHPLDLAVLFCGATPVSIYNSSAPEQVEYLVNDCGAKVAIVEDSGFLERFLKVRDALPTIEHIAVIEPFEGIGDDIVRYSDLAAFEPADLAVEAETVDARRPGHDHLHVGDHRSPEGRDAHAQQRAVDARVRRRDHARPDPHRRLRRQAARVVPPDGARDGAPPRPLLHGRFRHADRLLSRDLPDGGDGARGPPEHLHRCPPGVGEAVRRRERRARRPIRRRRRASTTPSRRRCRSRRR